MLGKDSIGKKVLVTTDNWFIAPDGESYRAIYGTLESITDAETTLGLKTNRNSTNWYVIVGNMLIAGCQIHYVIETQSCSFSPSTREMEHEGKVYSDKESMTRIYNADQQ